MKLRKLDRQDFETTIDFCQEEMKIAESSYIKHAFLLKVAEREAKKYPLIGKKEE